MNNVSTYTRKKRYIYSEFKKLKKKFPTGKYECELILKRNLGDYYGFCESPYCDTDTGNTISISISLKGQDVNDLFNTLLHEYAHALVFVKHANSKADDRIAKILGHTDEWGQVYAQLYREFNKGSEMGVKVR